AQCVFDVAIERRGLGVLVLLDDLGEFGNAGGAGKRGQAKRQKRSGTSSMAGDGHWFVSLALEGRTVVSTTRSLPATWAEKLLPVDRLRMGMASPRRPEFCARPSSDNRAPPLCTSTSTTAPRSTSLGASRRFLVKAAPATIERRGTRPRT